MRKKKLAFVLGIAVVVGVPAFAKKPDSPGNTETQASSRAKSAGSPAHQESDASHNYFNDDRRTHIREYYSSSRNAGNCPPGLAKKNNGCQPPGQLKKWRKGEPLSRDVIYYDLPFALMNELGPTPDGQRVVQVGTDLLLMSIATGMVIDAFEFQE
jgi:Ni/Co efflux regulator RcnB